MSSDTGSFIDRLVAGHLEHLTAATRAVRQRERHDFVVRRELDILEHDERTVDGRDGAVVEARVDAVVLDGRLGVDVKQLLVAHARIRHGGRS
jgi:hypothetical protein